MLARPTPGLVAAQGSIGAALAGAPDLSHSIHTGLVFFVGSHPVGSSALGKELVSGDAFGLMGSAAFTGDHPSLTGWKCLDVPGTTSDGAWKARGALIGLSNAYTIWIDVVLSELTSWSTLIGVPWNDNATWEPPFGGLKFARRSTTTASGYHLATDASSFEVHPANPGIDGSFPTTLERKRLWMTRNGATLKMGVNAAQVGPDVTMPTTAVPWHSMTADRIIIGNRSFSAPGEGCAGRYFRVMIWNRALSAQELADLDENPTLGLHPPPVNSAYFDLLDATAKGTGPSWHGNLGTDSGDTMVARRGGNGTWIAGIEFGGPSLLTLEEGASVFCPGDQGFGLIESPVTSASLTIDLALQLSAAANQYCLVNMDQNVGEAGRFSLELVSDGGGGMKPRVFSRNDAGAPVVCVGTSNGTVPIGTPFKITYVRNTSAGTQQVYINGQEIPLTLSAGTAPATWSPVPAGLWGVAGWPSGDDPLSPLVGLISDLAIWSSVLPLSDIQSLAVPAPLPAIHLSDFALGTVAPNNSVTVNLNQRSSPHNLTATITRQGTLGTANPNGAGSVNYAAGSTTGSDTFRAKGSVSDRDSRIALFNISVGRAPPPPAGFNEVLPYGGLGLGSALYFGRPGNFRFTSTCTKVMPVEKITSTLRSIAWNNRTDAQGGNNTGYSTGNGGTISVRCRRVTSIVGDTLTLGSILGETRRIVNPVQTTAWQEEWRAAGGSGPASSAFRNFPTLRFSTPINLATAGLNLLDLIAFQFVQHDSGSGTTSVNNAYSDSWLHWGSTKLARAGYPPWGDARFFFPSDKERKNHFPLLLLGYTDGVVKGNPWMGLAGTSQGDVLHLIGNTRGRQVIPVPGNITGRSVKAIHLSVVCNSGNATNGLVVQLRRAGGSPGGSSDEGTLLREVVISASSITRASTTKTPPVKINPLVAAISPAESVNAGLTYYVEVKSAGSSTQYLMDKMHRYLNQPEGGLKIPDHLYPGHRGQMNVGSQWVDIAGGGGTLPRNDLPVWMEFA